MADAREEEMLELMAEVNKVLEESLHAIRQMQNKVNEIWAEWTRTHGLRGIPGKGISTPVNASSQKVVRRSIKR